MSRGAKNALGGPQAAPQNQHWERELLAGARVGRRFSRSQK